MASSSSKLCSDEQLRKALDDLEESIIQNPIPHGFLSSADAEGGKTEKANDKLGKKKTKTVVMPQERVEKLLNMECLQLPEQKNIDKLVEDKYGIKTLTNISNVLLKHSEDLIRAAKEKIRYEVEIKGHFAYEANEEEKEDVVPAERNELGEA